MNKIKILNKFYLLVITVFCFTSCLQWAARAEKKLPEETALQKKYDFDGKVIVIGAGASGLAAAKVLEKNNIDYTILEWVFEKRYHFSRLSNRHWGRMDSQQPKSFKRN
jgi:TRAP-type uncharacterized transport system substrate-binding protein